MLELILPTLRADFELVETYVYGDSDPLACPILTIAGTQDQYVSPEESDAWGYLTSGRHFRRVLSGSHLFLLEAAAEVVELIVSYIRLVRLSNNRGPGVSQAAGGAYSI
jgi:medium-chain acyl-[acyl-carrier-protein] hydrolase